MQRDSLVAVFVMATLTACGVAAPGGGQAPAPANDALAAGRGDGYPGPSVASDMVSGCTAGASAVKVVITLTPADNNRCHAELLPGSVCVQPGGFIRWMIDNQCKPLEAPALEITVPTWKASLDGGRERPKGDASTMSPPLLESCAVKAPKSDKGSKEKVFCEVDKNATTGFYKYGLKGGQIDPLDPDVEVRGGK